MLCKCNIGLCLVATLMLSTWNYDFGRQSIDIVPGRIIRPSAWGSHLHTIACKKCAKEVDVRMSGHRCIVWSFIIAYGVKDTNVCSKHEICVVMCSRGWGMRHEIMLRCCVMLRIHYNGLSRLFSELEWHLKTHRWRCFTICFEN
jgi:hypothetical protein